ncbi:MAG TPA: hypothetical protein VIH42_00940 [Thermoguttaceae bacterium]
MSDFFYRLIEKPDFLALMVPIVAIVGGITLVIVKRAFSHRERMAMIERGIHPDFPPEDEESNHQIKK